MTFNRINFICMCGHTSSHNCFHEWSLEDQPAKYTKTQIKYCLEVAMDRVVPGYIWDKFEKELDKLR